MQITFDSFQKYHLMLLLKWLEQPHVKEWWDQDVIWTLDLIKEKYGTYIQGYKIENNISKPIHAYIISIDGIQIGYVQYYNAYDFEREESLENLPKNLAAFDIFIGESNYIGKGLGTKVLKQFCDDYIFEEFENCLADPEIRNLKAIRAYEKARFKEIYKTKDVVMMIKNKSRD